MHSSKYQSLTKLLSFMLILLTTYFAYAQPTMTQHVIYDRHYDRYVGFPPTSFSQDGKLFGTTALEENSVTLRLWDTRSYKLISALEIPGVRDFAISPDNKNIVTITGERGRYGVLSPYAIQIRGIHSGKIKRTIVKEGRIPAAFYSIIYSSDGKYIASDGGNELIYIWNASNGKELARFHFEGFAHAIAFSTDGRRLAALSGGIAFGGEPRLSVWSVNSKELIASVKTDDGFTSIAFSPNGKHLVADGYILQTQIYDAHNLKLLRQLSAIESVGGQNPITAFSPDGRLLTVAYGNYLTVRSATDPKHVVAHLAAIDSAINPEPALLAVHFISPNQVIWAAINIIDGSYKITLYHAALY